MTTVAATAQESSRKNSSEGTDTKAHELNVPTRGKHQQFFSSMRSSEGEQQHGAACSLRDGKDTNTVPDSLSVFNK